ncbi:MAG TPA: small ribosomal subunit Rsm22 family protein, partial [Myxococcaceae bacterium]|nr:small ribosomal subunit Rsm22 family protein [Myxococcaceae bacterium]
MNAYSKDLDAWIPRLLEVWRAQRPRGGGGPAPTTRLTPPEVKEVGAGVKRLSMGLTRDRALAGGRYMDDPRLLGAYLLFYWPVSYAQGRQVLGELSSRPRSVLDLGSGPGPLAFAAADAGAREVVVADRSRPALALARALAAEAGETLSAREWDPQRGDAPPDGPYDLVTAGHLFNELFGKGESSLGRRAALVEAMLSRVKKGGSAVIVEPALRETSRELLGLRDLMVSRGYAVRAPCLFRGPCPALLKSSDWCHAEREWPMPSLVAEIARAAGLHKEALKMSYLALAPKGEAWPEPPPGRLFRIVSEPLEGKGRQRYIGCGPEGRVGLALQEKHRTPENAAFFTLKRGDVVELTETESKGDGLG